MTMKTVRRLAADILNVGQNRVRILDTKKAAQAATREDVSNLIKEGVIKAVPVKGRRTKEKKERKARRGPGKRKGTPKSRKSKKEGWMERIRALRKYLNELIESGKLSKEMKRTLYLKIKGGHFMGKRMFYNYLKDMKLLKESKKE